MRKIILMMSASLDGFFETADRDISWHLVDDELLRHLNEQFRTMGAFIFGRVTHELMASNRPVPPRCPLSSPGSGSRGVAFCTLDQLGGFLLGFIPTIFRVGWDGLVSGWPGRTSQRSVPREARMGTGRPVRGRRGVHTAAARSARHEAFRVTGASGSGVSRRPTMSSMEAAPMIRTGRSPAFARPELTR
jgi:hypothetical protein